MGRPRTVLIVPPEPSDVRSQIRDGLLAVVGLAVLAGLSAATNRTQPFHPLGIAVGILAALALEVIFLQYSTRALALWKRQGVPLAGLGLLLLAAVVAVRFVPWSLAAAVWGLLTYLALLCCVLLGLENPVAVVLESVE